MSSKNDHWKSLLEFVGLSQPSTSEEAPAPEIPAAETVTSKAPSSEESRHAPAAKPAAEPAKAAAPAPKPAPPPKRRGHWSQLAGALGLEVAPEPEPIVEEPAAPVAPAAHTPVVREVPRPRPEPETAPVAETRAPREEAPRGRDRSEESREGGERGHRRGEARHEGRSHEGRGRGDHRRNRDHESRDRETTERVEREDSRDIFVEADTTPTAEIKSPAPANDPWARLLDGDDVSPSRRDDDLSFEHLGASEPRNDRGSDRNQDRGSDRGRGGRDSHRGERGQQGGRSEGGRDRSQGRGRHGERPQEQSRDRNAELVRERAPRSVDPRDIDPRDVDPRDIDPRDVDLRDAGPREPRSRDRRDRDPRDRSRDRGPRPVENREVVARDLDPRDIDPRDVDPRDVDPRDIDPRNSGDGEGRERGRRRRRGGRGRGRNYQDRPQGGAPRDVAMDAPRDARPAAESRDIRDDRYDLEVGDDVPSRLDDLVDPPAVEESGIDREARKPGEGTGSGGRRRRRGRRGGRRHREGREDASGTDRGPSDRASGDRRDSDSEFPHSGSRGRGRGPSSDEIEEDLPENQLDEDQDPSGKYRSHENIPTWHDAIDGLIEANMASRSSRPDHGGGRGGHRRGRGGGGR